MLAPAITGFVTAFSLILAIGAQNAFVLRQGLIQSHVFWLCLFCAVSDAVLIAVGVIGFGALVTLYPIFPKSLAYGGAAFLFTYGAMRFLAAFRGDYSLVLEGKSNGLWSTLAVAAALTWLNPHVYLDTLGLIGTVSTQYSQVAQKTAFAIGAAASSFVFFFGLGYGARYLAPIMQSARAWRRLDSLIGVIMFYLAYGLLTADI